MAEAAGTSTVQRLLNSVEEFKQYHARLTDYRYGAAIARTHNNQLMHDYGAEVVKADETKRRIEAVTGAWDRVKEWSGLGAIPLVPVAIAVGLIAAVTAAVISIKDFMRRADIALAMERDPALTYEAAATQVDKTTQGPVGKALDIAQLGLFTALAFMAYRLLAR